MADWVMEFSSEHGRVRLEADRHGVTLMQERPPGNWRTIKLTLADAQLVGLVQSAFEYGCFKAVGADERAQFARDHFKVIDGRES